MIQKAKQNPDVLFEHATGFQRADNVSTYFVQHWEPSYLLGMIAGRMTKSNRLGYVGSFPIPEVIRDVNSFTLGAQSVNPDVKVQDGLHQHLVRPAEGEAGGEVADRRGRRRPLRDRGQPLRARRRPAANGVLAATWNSDMSRFGPEAFLSAYVLNWGDHYVERVQAAMDGTWESEDYWGTLEEGSVAARAVRRVGAGGGSRRGRREARRLQGRQLQPVRRADQGPGRARCASPDGHEMTFEEFVALGLVRPGRRGQAARASEEQT